MFENRNTLPSCICIQGTHQEHFKTIVDYLFPGESESLIYSKVKWIQIFFPNTRALKLGVGCQSMGYMDIWSSYIRDLRMDGKHQIFMTIVTKRVQKLQWFGLMMASYLVDFLINYRHPLEDGVSRRNISCSLWRVHQINLDPQICV